LKLLNKFIVEIENDDTLDSISDWIHKHKNSDKDHVIDISSWLFVIKAGDVIIFNSFAGQGMYRLDEFLREDVNMLTIDNRSKKKRRK